MEKIHIIPELKRITIGRSDDNNIILTPTNIGRHHAVITITGKNTYLIEDLNSKHGTYVNLERVHRKLISGEDKISFATNHYITNEILGIEKNAIPSSIQSKENDYTEEFEKMKILWEQYQLFKSEEINIQNAIKKANEHLRLGGVLTAATVGVGGAVAKTTLAVVLGATFVEALPIIAACGLGMLIPAIGSKFLGEDEKLSQPRLYFANNWKCPRCGDKVGLLNKSWETLAKQKKCAKCDAIWVK